MAKIPKMPIPELARYSKGKEFAFYEDGSISHRHILEANDPAQLQLGIKQAYYLFVKGKCSKCGIISPKQ